MTETYVKSSNHLLDPRPCRHCGYDRGKHLMGAGGTPVCPTRTYYDPVPPMSEAPALPKNVMRYKVQQNKGQYALKGCDDGDLVDYSEYEALLRQLRALKATVGTKIQCPKCGTAHYLSNVCPTESAS